MLELELGPLSISKSSNLANPPATDFWWGLFLLKGIAQRFPCEFQQGKLHIHCVVDSLLSSFRFIVPSPGWMPVSVTRHAVAAAFCVQAPRPSPDRFMAPRNVNTYDG
jgi:hypothetical protein